MNGHSFRSRRAALRGLAATAAVAAAPALRAQTLLKAPQTVPLRSRVAAVTGVSNVRVASAQGEVETAPDVPIADSAALSHFHFHFHNGDHKFRLLQLLVDDPQRARVAFNDQNDDDPYEATAQWVNISGGSRGMSSASGHGRAITPIRLNHRPKGHVFALRGFEFRRPQGTDANIRHISIRFSVSAIEVVLADDEGMDFRGPGGAAMVFDPVHNYVVAQATRNRQPGRPYTVAVQYVWIPEVLVAQTGTITGSERGVRDAASVPPGRAVISGFSFSFLNSDHHLLNIAGSTLDGGMARFRDNNEDDPVRWRIDYALLRA